MKHLSTLLILLSAAFLAAAQPTMPTAPGTCNINACTTNSNIDVCPAGSTTVVSSHIGGLYNRGNSSNHLGANAVWRFRNMATVSGTTVNVEVTIDAIYHAELVTIDDDGAVDQAGNSIAYLFSPKIGADQTLNGTDRRGYVQFTMRFFKNNSGHNDATDADFATSVNLSNLNYVHYDIDGNDAGAVNKGAAGSWFRETGSAKVLGTGNPIVLANSSTDLVSYNYTDPVTTTWTGYAGGTCERDGVSKCAQVASSFFYSGALPSITFRMGYDYNAGGNVGQPVREYGSRLGCFNFPSFATLPVKLTSFAAFFKNQSALLNWTTDNEIDFDKYVVERSNTGTDFTAVGEKTALGLNARNSYDWSDDLSNVSGTTFFYRLKMVDKDGRFSYSSIVMIRKEAKAINGISLNPNPIASGATTVRFTSSRAAAVDFRVIDMSGKTVWQQQNKVYEGQNSISLGQLDRLQPGIYTLQLFNEGEVSVTRFTVIR